MAREIWGLGMSNGERRPGGLPEAALAFALGAAALSLPAQAQQSLGDFEQLGLRFGAVDVLPQLSFGVTYTDNVFAVPDDRFAAAGTPKEGDFVFVLRPRLLVQTNAQRHRWYALGSGNLGRYDKFTDRDYNDFTVETGGRWDISRRSSLSAVAAYDNLHLQTDDPDRLANRETVDYHRYRAGLGFARDGTRTFVRLNTSVTHREYDDVSDGIDETRFLNRVRVGYRLDRQYDVFVEGRYAVTTFDNPPGARNRDQQSASLLVGTSVDFDRLVAGEFAVGIEHTTFDDDLTDDQTGFSFSGALDFTLTPRTTLAFDASQAVEPTDSVGASGRNTTRVGLALSHVLSRHITLGANTGYSRFDFLSTDRVDQSLRGGLSARYSFNRYLSMSASYNYTERFSRQEARDYTENRVFLSLLGRY